METQNKGTIIFRSVLAVIGTTVVYLLIGTTLDYIITQITSQFVIADCSEDCYFRYFNTIFIIIALLSVAGGLRSGLRAYKRLSQNRV